MKNYKTILEELNFHDSNIESFKIFNENGNRKAIIKINYYNWEGNQNESENWKWRKLMISFEHLVHFVFNAPDLDDNAFEIMETEFDIGIEKLIELEKKKKDKFSQYKSHLLDQHENYLSIKFMTSNWGDSFIGENSGYILIIGCGIRLEWNDDNAFQGQIHIPIKK